MTLTSTGGAAGSAINAVAHAQNLSIGFTCVGGDDLYGLVKVKNAYTPTALERLTFRLKAIRTN
jgi:hypothetical protein